MAGTASHGFRTPPTLSLNPFGSLEWEVGCRLEAAHLLLSEQELSKFLKTSMCPIMGRSLCSLAEADPTDTNEKPGLAVLLGNLQAGLREILRPARGWGKTHLSTWVLGLSYLLWAALKTSATRSIFSHSSKVRSH